MIQLRGTWVAGIPSFPSIQALLFYSGLQLIGWVPLTLERTITLLSLLMQMLILSRIVFGQMSGHAIAQSG